MDKIFSTLLIFSVISHQIQAWQEEVERARQGQRDAESKLSLLEASLNLVYHHNHFILSVLYNWLVYSLFCNFC